MEACIRAVLAAARRGLVGRSLLDLNEAGAGQVSSA